MVKWKCVFGEVMMGRKMEMEGEARFLGLSCVCDLRGASG